MNLRTCLNWKVIGALAAIGLGIVMVAPGLAAAALPLLVLAACPLSMLVMAFGMAGMGRDRARMSAREPGQTYTCPMHPQVRQAAAAPCPTCGMALTPAPEVVSDEMRLSDLRSTLVALQVEEAAVTRAIAALEPERVARSRTVNPRG